MLRDYTITLNQDELDLLIAALWLMEHQQNRIATRAQDDENERQAEQCRESAAQARQLADRLADIAYSE